MKHSNYKKASWSDYYTRQAKIDKYPARAVYKLKEIQGKYNLLKKGDRVLDLGCAPGSWLTYAAEIVGSKGIVIGIDLNQIGTILPKNALIFNYDVLSFDITTKKEIKKGFNSVISDMAPCTTGSKRVDAARSFVLCSAALEIADSVLKPGGMFVCKIFQGSDLKKFSSYVNKKFKRQLLFKPKSSRKTSKEIYVIGLNKL